MTGRDETRSRPPLLDRLVSTFLRQYGDVIEGMSRRRLNRIADTMQNLADAGRIAGTTTLVVRNGKVAHFSSIGFQDRERNIPMSNDSIYRIYSMTKPITAAAVMILAEEGRFLLEEPVSKYLPEFEGAVVLVEHEDGTSETRPAKPMTIRHLLTHTAGLTYAFVPSVVASRYEDAGISSDLTLGTHKSLADLTTAIAKMPLISQPGAEWHYSMSFDVLGRLVEVVSNMDLRAFMRERIFDPLDMPDTDFFVPEAKLHRFAARYQNINDSLQLQDDPHTSHYRIKPDVFLGGSGLVGTANDYARFAQMLLNGGILDGVRLLSPATVDLMLTNQLPPGLPTESFDGAVVQMTYGDDWGMGFGLGGFVLLNPEKTGIPASPGCYGWAGAAGTNFWIDPALKLAGIVMIQQTPGHAFAVREMMQAMTYQAVVRL